jgi:pimeloyl-ACP methyl ester carboxylesterase/DNA-binding CsgD family transcriptional regulator
MSDPSFPSLEDLDLIEASYRMVNDASGFDDLLTAWQAKIDVSGNGYLLNGAALSLRLEKFEGLMSGPLLAPNETPIDKTISEARTALMVLSPDGAVIALNALAETRYQLRQGVKTDFSWLSPDSQSDFNRIKATCTRGGNAQYAIVRLTDNGEATTLAEVFALHPTEGGTPLIAVKALELPWTPKIEQILREAFDMTAAEIEVARLMLITRDTADIAARRGTTVLTVRTQLRSIFAKTETVAQVDLVRMLSVLCGSQTDHSAEEDTIWQDPYYYEAHIIDQAGRKIAYSWTGASAGTPALFLHGPAIGYALPQSLIAYLKAQNVKLIMMHRPGHGYSDPNEGVDSVIASSLAVEALLEHLHIGPCTVIGVTSAATALIHLGRHRRDLVSGILCLGGVLSLNAPEVAEHMPREVRMLGRLRKLAPWAVNLIALAGQRTMRQKGLDWYLERAFSDSPYDLATLRDPETMALSRNSCQMLLAQGIKSWASDFDMLSHSWYEDLAECTAPVRMIIGRHGQYNQAELLLRHHSESPGLELEIVEDAAQLIMYQHPELIAQRICDAISDWQS